MNSKQQRGTLSLLWRHGDSSKTLWSLYKV